MKRLGLVAAGALLAALALGDEVAVPPLRARVTDLTATLSASEIQTLETRLREFESLRGSQIAVLILPSTQPETIEQYSIRLAEAWKIGRAKVDDGVILVVAKNDRRLRIEVGRGLEGAIPDGIAMRVIGEVITPRFKANDFYGGVSAGADALIKLIEGEPLPAPSATGLFELELNFQAIFWLLVALAFSESALKRLIGRIPASLISGGIVGAIVGAFTGILLLAILGAFVGFFGALFIQAEPGRPSRARGRSSGSDSGWSIGGWSGGSGWSGGGGASGGFGGGGGDFGGGGASGSW